MTRKLVKKSMKVNGRKTLETVKELKLMRKRSFCTKVNGRKESGKAKAKLIKKDR